MIITKEQQDMLVNNYAKTSTSDMTIGFIHGLNAMLELIAKLEEAKKNNLIK